MKRTTVEAVDHDIEAALARQSERTFETPPEADEAWRERSRTLYTDLFTPPPRLSLAEWSDEHRVLSAGPSAEAGRYRTDRAPYLRGILDAMGDPRIERVVIMKSAQVGASEALLNLVAYHVAMDPAPILMVLPTVELGHSWSTERLAPMIRDCPILRGRVHEPHVRDSGNRIASKQFPGGAINIVGANSPSGLSSRAARIVICDEIDRFPLSAGSEGSPVALAFQRSVTFVGRRKLVCVSTPTVKDFSAIERMFLESTQQFFHVSCASCGHTFKLLWEHVQWEKGHHEGAYLVCPGCGVVIPESERMAMVRRGQWVAENPNPTPIVGFHISALFSPWSCLGDLACEFRDAQGQPERIRSFVNLALGNPYESNEGAPIEAHQLYTRLEPYKAAVPDGVAYLTCGVDCQNDRILACVWGWGHASESWLIATGWFDGDPTLDPAASSAWRALDEWLAGGWESEYGKDQTHRGLVLPIAITFVDSGYGSKSVYEFTRARGGRGIYAVKGNPGEAQVLLYKTRPESGARTILYLISGTIAKDSILGKLRTPAPGPNYVHLNERVADQEFLEQLLAERPITRYRYGHPIRQWHQMRAANHALDMFCYALGACAALGKTRVDGMAKEVERLHALGEKQRAGPPTIVPGGEERESDASSGYVPASNTPAPAAKKTPMTVRTNWARDRWRK